MAMLVYQRVNGPSLPSNGPRSASWFDVTTQGFYLWGGNPRYVGRLETHGECPFCWHSEAISVYVFPCISSDCSSNAKSKRRFNVVLMIPPIDTTYRHVFRSCNLDHQLVTLISELPTLSRSTICLSMKLSTNFLFKSCQSQMLLPSRELRNISHLRFFFRKIIIFQSAKIGGMGYVIVPWRVYHPFLHQFTPFNTNRSWDLNCICRHSPGGISWDPKSCDKHEAWNVWGVQQGRCLQQWDKNGEKSWIPWWRMMIFVCKWLDDMSLKGGILVRVVKG